MGHAQLREGPRAAEALPPGDEGTTRGRRSAHESVVRTILFFISASLLFLFVRRSSHVTLRPLLVFFFRCACATYPHSQQQDGSLLPRRDPPRQPPPARRARPQAEQPAFVVGPRDVGRGRRIPRDGTPRVGRAIHAALAPVGDDGGEAVPQLRLDAQRPGRDGGRRFGVGVAAVDSGAENVRAGPGRERRRQGVEGVRVRTIGGEPCGAQGTERRDGGGRDRFRRRRHDSRGGIVFRPGEKEEGRNARDGGRVVLKDLAGGEIGQLFCEYKKIPNSGVHMRMHRERKLREETANCAWRTGEILLLRNLT